MAVRANEHVPGKRPQANIYRSSGPLNMPINLVTRKGAVSSAQHAMSMLSGVLRASYHAKTSIGMREWPRDIDLQDGK